MFVKDQSPVTDRIWIPNQMSYFWRSSRYCVKMCLQFWADLNEVIQYPQARSSVMRTDNQSSLFFLGGGRGGGSKLYHTPRISYPLGYPSPLERNWCQGYSTNVDRQTLNLLTPLLAVGNDRSTINIDNCFESFTKVSLAHLHFHAC